MIIGVTFCGCQVAKVTIYSEDEIWVKRQRRGGISNSKKLPFFLNRVENGSRGWFL
jgi:hypothetical protein